ncbi:MAG TPA: cysteine hydrolase [Acidimicrobiales bacterium]|jgi:nicotinamidase-related amidase
MPSIPELVEPGSTAIVCHEMQRGVVGDLAAPGFQTAQAVAESGIIPRNARLFDAARANGIRVIHCAAAFRPNRVGSFANTPQLAALMSSSDYLVVGTPSVDPVPELWQEDDDVVMHRFHGMSSFAGTELDWLLRSLNATTVILTGVSVNRGITGQTIEAVNFGYRVVIPTDCVVGYPKEYSDMMLEHTLAPLAWLTTADEVVKAWK